MLLLRGLFLLLLGFCIEGDKMRAIPISLLIHTAALQKSIKKDRWGNESDTDKTHLYRIRVEPSSKIVRNKSSAEIQLAAVLFYDCKNSRPKNVKIQEDDIIIFNGDRYSVQIVDSLYDEKRLHHYEIGLIKHA